MKLHPTRISPKFLCFIFISLSILLSCNKDSDLLNDALFNEASQSVEDRAKNEKQESGEEPEEVTTAEPEVVPEAEEPEPEQEVEPDLESRTTSFPPLHDAHLQSGKGYNQHIIRLEEGHRTSYLMFDLAKIDSIGGEITGATLQITINSDDGNGTVNVYKGVSNDWTESDLTSSTPETGVQLGSVAKEYKIGATEEIELSADQLFPEPATLILDHQDGNDLAFASKEHPTAEGPKLVVTYNAPVDSEAIVIGEEDDVTEEETNTEEEVASEEETTSEETTENEPPMAVADATPSTGTVPFEVAFKGNNSTDDKEIKKYAWDFKDGGTGNTANPTHTFDKVGTFEVTLTVTDEEGLTDTDTVTITATDEENQAPKAVATATPSSGTAPLEVQFKGSNSTDDNAISSYAWDFKDGASATNANPSHSFTEAGTYQVELTVKDENGLSDKETITITVTEPEPAQNEAPIAVITANPLTGDAPLEVFFQGDKSTDDNGITSYFWDFKDGGTGTNTTPSHDFTQPGVYEVELTVTDAQGLSDTASVTITVNESSGGGNNGGGNNGNYPSNAVMASSFGYNSSNATSAIENAIESNNSFIVIDKQSSDWIVEPLWFNSLSNKTIVFEEGVILRAKSGTFQEAERLFQLTNSQNIEILGYGATFQMNKGQYSGQQSHALSIINSTDITVKGLVLRDSGGDGIYISRYNEGQYSKNILIEDVLATNNDRQGMAVVSVDGLVVKNSTFSNTSGEYPGAGVDFEPESTQDRLSNITFENCNFTDNFGPGILFALAKTDGSSRPLDVTFKNVYLSNNFSTQNTQEPAEIDLGFSTNNRYNPIKGSITFDGLRVENSKWGAIWTKKTLEAYSVTIKNATIKNVSKSSNRPAIHIGLLSYGNTSNANMGGFTFSNVLIDYDGVDPSLELFGPSHGNWHLRNMSGEIRVRSPRGIRLHDNLNRLSNSGSSVTLRVIED